MTTEEILLDHEGSIDRLWVLVSAAMIFLMQAGFSLVEAGSVRLKSSSNILIKNLFDACIGAIGWYLLGYGFAYGNEDSGEFIGNENFAQGDLDGQAEKDAYYLAWVFQFTFCATAATIVSGSLAERTYLETYLLYAALMCSFIYPVVAHWVWHPKGWLQDNDVAAYIDFAGSGAVHLVGGASGFIGAWILGSRYDIFKTFADPLKQSTIGGGGNLVEMASNDTKVTAIARQLFNKYDTRKNNVISKQEFVEAIKEMHVQEDLQQTPEHGLSEIWDQVDVDKHGELSFAEFKKLVKTVLDLKVKMAQAGAAVSPEEAAPEVLELMANSPDFDEDRLFEVVGDTKFREQKIEKLLKQLPDPASLGPAELRVIEDILKADTHDFRPNSIQSVVLGTFILWICWLFFNAGSTAKMAQLDGAEPSLIMMNTIIGGAAGGFTSVFLKHPIAGTYSNRNKYDVGALCNGILIGLVSVTAGCNNIEPWAALAIGASSAVVLGLSTRLMNRLKIDDPLEASQVHGFGGIWGVFVVGFFDRDEGIFYGADGDQLAIQISGILAITAWAMFWSGAFFMTLKLFKRFRVPLIYEVVGLDYVEHGGSVASRP